MFLAAKCRTAHRIRPGGAAVQLQWSFDDFLRPSVVCPQRAFLGVLTIPIYRPGGLKPFIFHGFWFPRGMGQPGLFGRDLKLRLGSDRR